MESLLQVVSVETLHSDKSNCDFKKVTFKGVKFIGNREVKTNVAGTRNLWPDHEVTLQDGTKSMIKGDVDYATIMQGDLFDGQVHNFTTTPYVLEGRQINQYKCVVFASENPMVVAARNLRQNSAAPLDENGVAFQLMSSPIVRQTPQGVVPNASEVIEGDEKGEEK